MEDVKPDGRRRSTRATVREEQHGSGSEEIGECRMQSPDIKREMNGSSQPPKTEAEAGENSAIKHVADGTGKDDGDSDEEHEVAGIKRRTRRKIVSDDDSSSGGEKKEDEKDDNWVENAIGVLKNIMKDQSAKEYFNAPVEPEKYGLDDYFDIIKCPMDLGSVLKRLNPTTRKQEKEKYSNPDEFVSDVHLAFNNATTYNPPNDTVWNAASHLMDKFNRSWKKVNNGKVWMDAARVTPFKASGSAAPNCSGARGQRARSPDEADGATASRRGGERRSAENRRGAEARLSEGRRTRSGTVASGYDKEGSDSSDGRWEPTIAPPGCVCPQIALPSRNPWRVATLFRRKADAAPSCRSDDSGYVREPLREQYMLRDRGTREASSRDNAPTFSREKSRRPPARS